MPNRIMPWNAVTAQGNPTRSIEVNELLKRVKKKEVRKQGADPKARRPMTHDEFKRTQSLLMASPADDLIRRYGIPSLFKFQYNLIARIDDSTQFILENLTASADFDFTLRSKLNWSKNVNEERDAPNQILIGAMDPMYCVLLGLAVFLEVFIESGGGELTPYVFGFNPDERVPEGGVKAKETVQNILAGEIYNRDDFNTTKGPLGTHSVRKLASTHARKNGCSKDEKDIRGRWKKGMRVSDVYDDIELPFPDAKVAGKLCIGGPCKYVIKEGSGVTDNFLLQHVVPNICTRLPADVAKVLAKPLLWMLFSSQKTYLPQAMRDRVSSAYNNIRLLPAAENPVKKILLVVTGNEGEVYLDEVGTEQNQMLRQTNERELLMALHSQISTLRRSVEELKATQQQHRLDGRREFQVLSANLRRIAAQPVVRRAAEEQNQGGAPAGGFAGTLSPNPRTLYLLWGEYEHGIGGRKAARLFTREERGRVKHKYHRRKIVWDCVSAQVRAGVTAQVAIDRMYVVYGVNTTVTAIINRMKQDRQAGTVHPALQV
jgi:hypothetical protein